jgi:T4 RnlA family RNA ligase
MDSSNSLYNNLLQLTQDNEAFYFADYGPYRVFNYRLASYTDFLAPDALEARGIMFYMNGPAPELVCRPFKKFFNMNENPFTMNLDFSKVQKVAVKEDGSIISSYIDRPTGELRLKSKQSLWSEQTKMANEFLAREENERLKQETKVITEAGCTVIFELVSPANRIVLEYSKTELRVLGIRNTATGDLWKQTDVPEAYYATRDAWCTEFNFIDPESVAAMEGIEGYVYTFTDGTMAKVKTDWYKTLHHLKDSINATRHLFEAIIDERIDDVKAMFATDQFTMDRIKEMEDLVIPKYNHMVNTVEDFYAANKDLEVKDFAVKGQKELGAFFTLAMNKKRGKDSESAYKDFSKKHREEHFGVKVTHELVEAE